MRGQYWIVAGLAIIILALSIGFTIKGATECAAKGGVYLTGKNTWPVCLKGETL